MTPRQLREYIAETAVKISHKLGRSGRRMATAESCTGGRVAASLCSVAGASAWFDTGVVAYTYESKREILGVPQEVLDLGLVSELTAKTMAKRIQHLRDCDYAVSTTGVCGPSYSEGHAPCYVWIAVASPDGIETRLVSEEDQGRESNVLAATASALELLLEVIGR